MNTILSENIELCLFVKLTNLGIGEISGTHTPASSRLCFQVTKRRHTEERGLGQQDYTRRIISSPYSFDIETLGQKFMEIGKFSIVCIYICINNVRDSYLHPQMHL